MTRLNKIGFSIAHLCLALLLILLVTLVRPFSSVAQTQDSLSIKRYSNFTNDSTVTEITEIIKVNQKYIPSLEKRAKITFSPSLDTTSNSDSSSFDYTIDKVLLDYYFNAKTLKAPPLEKGLDTSFNIDKEDNGYLRALIGFPVQSKLDLYYTFLKKSPVKMAFFLNHYGWFDKVSLKGDKREAASTTNRVGTTLFYTKERLHLSSTLYYQYSHYLQYGYKITKVLTRADNDFTSRKQLRKSFHDIGLSLSLGTPTDDSVKWNYRFTTDFSLLSDNRYSLGNKVMDNSLSLSLSGDVNKYLKKKHIIGIALNYDLATTKELTPKLSSTKSTSLNIVKISPYYSYLNPYVHFKLGVDLVPSFHTKGSEFLLFPNIDLFFKTKLLEVEPFIALKGNMEILSYNNLYHINPYLESGSPTYSHNNLNASIGIRGNIMEILCYTISGGFIHVGRSYIWENLAPLENVFQLRSYKNNTIASFIKADLNLTLSKFFSADFFLSAYNKQINWRTPLEFGTALNFNITDKLSASAKLRIETPIKMFHSNLIFKRGYIFDLGVGLNYKMPYNIILHLELNNLLNKPLLPLFNYPGVKINGLLGFTWSF